MCAILYSNNELIEGLHDIARLADGSFCNTSRAISLNIAIVQF